MNVSNYLKFFDLQDNFTEAELKIAYRREAKKWHPDVNHAPEAEEIFKQINTAFDTLKASIGRVNSPPWNSTPPWTKPKEKYQWNPPPPSDKRKPAPTGAVTLYRFVEGMVNGAYGIMVPNEVFVSGGVIYATIVNTTKEFRLTLPPVAKPHFDSFILGADIPYKYNTSVDGKTYRFIIFPEDLSGFKDIRRKG